MSLGIECISISEADSKKLKNQADIKMSVDLIKNSYERHEPFVVIVTGDDHFLPVVNSLKQRGIKVCIASSNNSCGKQLQKSADQYIPLLLKRPKGTGSNVYLSVLKLFENSLDLTDAHMLLVSILNIFCRSYIRNLFSSSGIQLSTLVSLVRHYMSFNADSLGYRTAADFARAATANTDFCVAYRGTDCKEVKLFLRDFVDQKFTVMSDLPVVNVTTKDYYHQVSNLPEDFSIDKMLNVLNKIKGNFDDLPEIIEYVKIMKDIGIIEIKDKKMIITRRNYFANAVRNYISSKVTEKGIPVDESILHQFK